MESSYRALPTSTSNNNGPFLQDPRFRSLGISARKNPAIVFVNQSESEHDDSEVNCEEARGFKYERAGTTGSFFNVEGFELDEEDFLMGGGDQEMHRAGSMHESFGHVEYELRRDSILEEEEEGEEEEENHHEREKRRDSMDSANDGNGERIRVNNEIAYRFENSKSFSSTASSFLSPRFSSFSDSQPIDQNPQDPYEEYISPASSYLSSRKGSKFDSAKIESRRQLQHQDIREEEVDEISGAGLAEEQKRSKHAGPVCEGFEYHKEDESFKNLTKLEKNRKTKTKKSTAPSDLFSPINEKSENPDSLSSHNKLQSSRLFSTQERPSSSSSNHSVSKVQRQHRRDSSSSSINLKPPLPPKNPARASFSSENSFDFSSHPSGEESTTSVSSVAPQRSESSSSYISQTHRYTEPLDQVVRLIKEFDYPTSSSSKGINVNLEKKGWDYHGVSKNGVRIYSKSPDMVENDNGVCYEPLEEEIRSNYQYMKRESSWSRGESESLPYIRGEGWIDGDWKVEDVLATIANYGARRVWDARLDPNNSNVVEILNDSDALAHISVKAAFPVGERDMVIAQRLLVSEDGKSGYFAARSVQDPSLPAQSSVHRSHLHFYGWSLKKLPYPPEYDRQEVVPLKTPNLPRASSPSEDSGSDKEKEKKKQDSYSESPQEMAPKLLNENQERRRSGLGGSRFQLDPLGNRSRSGFIPQSTSVTGFSLANSDNLGSGRISASSSYDGFSPQSSWAGHYGSSSGFNGDYRRSSFGESLNQRLTRESGFAADRPSRRSSLQAMGIKTKKSKTISPPAFLRPLSATGVVRSMSAQPTGMRRQASLDSRAPFGFPSPFDGSMPVSTPLVRSKSLAKINPLSLEQAPKDAAFFHMVLGASQSASRSSTPLMSRTASLQRESSEEKNHLPPRRPGILVTMICRISPGGPLPLTYVNISALKLPVQVGTVESYCHKYGFAPYLQRRGSKSGLDVLAEEFDPLVAKYKVIFRCRDRLKGQETRIRFFGGTFGKGRFSIEVLRATNWWVEYDNADESSSSSNSFSTRSSQGSLSIDPLSRRSSMFFESRLDNSVDSHSKPTTPWAPSSDQPSWTKKSPGSDGSLLPGSQGPCTLVIENTITGVPIQVIISKTSSISKPSLQNGGKRRLQLVRQPSQIFSQAAKDHMERSRSSTIDDLYRKMGIADDRLAAGLENTRQLFRRLSRMDDEDFDNSTSGVPSSLNSNRHSSGSGTKSSIGMSFTSSRYGEDYVSTRNLSSISSKSGESDYDEVRNSLGEVQARFNSRRISSTSYLGQDAPDSEEDEKPRRKTDNTPIRTVQRPTEPRAQSDGLIKKVQFEVA